MREVWERRDFLFLENHHVSFACGEAKTAFKGPCRDVCEAFLNESVSFVWVGTGESDTVFISEKALGKGKSNTQGDNY